jgi:hypothetical protein
MEYERERKEKLLQHKLEKRRKGGERTFLGKKLDFPSLIKVDGGLEFSRNLSEKFKIKR